jgi:DNA uptake protein ComE-like DNA-binding protein
MRLQIQLSSAKNYILGFATSGVFLVAGLFYFNSTQATENAPDTFSEIRSDAKSSHSEFNPNDLSAAQWQQLGFSEKQVATILKYKSILGGNFQSKAELQKCYVISEEKFSELEPYILLPDKVSENQKSARCVSHYNSNRRHFTYSGNSFSNKKTLKIPGKFNPDHYSAEDFMALGFSEKQANSILKYKNYLGGSFQSKEKFGECFVISVENFQKLAPYLLLPDKTSAEVTPQKNFYAGNFKAAKKEITYEPFDPNITDLEGWKNLGFSEKQAQVILNYRDRNLRGSFKNLEEISRCFVISPEKFEALKPFIVLNPENIKERKFTANNGANSANRGESNSQKFAADPTDFSKTDLNEITFKQLLEFGFDERSAASFLGFRKKLGGFMAKNQILETYNIDKDLAQKLVEIAPLNTDNVERYSLLEAPEEWLKNHPYFKYYADKIIYYRISSNNEKKIFKTMKIKPEAEQKMKLYLK